MARSDLLLSLVKAGTSGDRRAFQATTEAIIAEERAKKHIVLADRLSRAIQQNGNGTRMPAPSLVTPVRQQWNFSPPETIREVEDYRAELASITALDLIIVPNVNGG